jgi:hypothetical protein
MKYLLLPFILLLSYVASAQQTCLCSQNFDFAYQKLKDNYAGWSDKVRPDNQAAFDELSTEIKEKAKGITNDRECFYLLKKWFDFFHDGHVFITPITPYTIDDSPEVVATRASKVSVLSFNEISFMQYLKDNDSKLENVEGIWESDDKAYRVGILKDKKDPKKYTGFLLADRDATWKTGKVKFEMTQIAPLRYVTKYYYADFSTETSFTREVKNFLIMENLYKFAKIFPIPKEEVSDEEII